VLMCSTTALLHYNMVSATAAVCKLIMTCIERSKLSQERNSKQYCMYHTCCVMVSKHTFSLSLRPLTVSVVLCTSSSAVRHLANGPTPCLYCTYIVKEMNKIAGSGQSRYSYQLKLQCRSIRHLLQTYVAKVMIVPEMNVLYSSMAGVVATMILLNCLLFSIVAYQQRTIAGSSC
jgi:hypothetical protein